MALTNAVHVTSLGRTNRNQVGTSKATGGQVSPRVNVGNAERQISLAAGAVAAVFGVARRDVPGLLLAALGAGLVYRGASGHCSVYDALGIDSRNTDGGEDRPQSVQVVESFLVDKPVDELYTFWRDLENLPTIYVAPGNGRGVGRATIALGCSRSENCGWQRGVGRRDCRRAAE